MQNGNKIFWKIAKPNRQKIIQLEALHKRKIKPRSHWSAFRSKLLRFRFTKIFNKHWNKLAYCIKLTIGNTTKDIFEHKDILLSLILMFEMQCPLVANWKDHSVHNQTIATFTLGLNVLLKRVKQVA